MGESNHRGVVNGNVRGVGRVGEGGDHVDGGGVLVQGGVEMYRGGLIIFLDTKHIVEQ